MTPGLAFSVRLELRLILLGALHLLLADTRPRWLAVGLARFLN